MKQILKRIVGVVVIDHNIKFFAVLVCLVLVTAFSLSSFVKTTLPPQKPKDIQTVLQSLSSPVYAADVAFFLKIDGIPGESTDPQHRGEVEIMSWSWGSSQTAPSGGPGNSGKPNFQDFSFTTNVTKASPKLFIACASAKPIKDALLSVRSVKGPQVDFLKITFSDLLCKSFNEKGDPQNLVPLDQVSLNFTKIEIEYTQLGNDGKPVAPPIIESWDFKK